MAAKDIIDKVTGTVTGAVTGADKAGTTLTIGTNGGEICIADGVVAMIAALAASETEGVSGVGETYTSEIMSKVGIHDKTKGVKVAINEGIVKISMLISIKNGKSIPSVVQKVQSKVKSSVETMTGMTVKTVNVRVINVEI
ncbi:MAG: Asp23/Gls24 family envelope stress response protein [Lachnospiraceae bacterium]|nr:Asp23/Gls24 family envelope stress response protein [Lachnospiraceae bacterium]